MLSPRNFATMATWRNDFSVLTHVVLPRLGNASFWTLLCLNAVPDPDPEIRGGGGSSRPWDKGGARSPKNIFRPFGPQFGLNIRGTGPPTPPLEPPLKCVLSTHLSIVLFIVSFYLISVSCLCWNDGILVTASWDSTVKVSFISKLLLHVIKPQWCLSYLLGKLYLLGTWLTNLRKMEIQSILVAYER